MYSDYCICECGNHPCLVSAYKQNRQVLQICSKLSANPLYIQHDSNNFQLQFKTAFSCVCLSLFYSLKFKYVKIKPNLYYVCKNDVFYIQLSYSNNRVFKNNTKSDWQTRHTKYIDLSTLYFGIKVYIFTMNMQLNTTE